MSSAFNQSKMDNIILENEELKLRETKDMAGKRAAAIRDAMLNTA